MMMVILTSGGGSSHVLGCRCRRRPVTADDVSELRDEPISLLVGPAEREQLLELIEDEHETLKVVAPPHLEPTEQIPERRGAVIRACAIGCRVTVRPSIALLDSRIWSSMSLTARARGIVEPDDDREEAALAQRLQHAGGKQARSCRFRTRRKPAIGRRSGSSGGPRRSPAFVPGTASGRSRCRRTAASRGTDSGQVPVRDRSARRGRVVRCQCDDLIRHYCCRNRVAPGDVDVSPNGPHQFVDPIRCAQIDGLQALQVIDLTVRAIDDGRDQKDAADGGSTPGVRSRD